MTDQKKIGVDAETHDLVDQIAEAESRSMSGQVRHWAKEDARRLGIGTAKITKPNIKIAQTKPEVTTNEN